MSSVGVCRDAMGRGLDSFGGLSAFGSGFSSGGNAISITSNPCCLPVSMSTPMVCCPDPIIQQVSCPTSLPQPCPVPAPIPQLQPYPVPVPIRECVPVP